MLNSIRFFPYPPPTYLSNNFRNFHLDSREIEILLSTSTRACPVRPLTSVVGQLPRNNTRQLRERRLNATRKRERNRGLFTWKRKRRRGCRRKRVDCRHWTWPRAGKFLIYSSNPCPRESTLLRESKESFHGFFSLDSHGNGLFTG